MATDVLKILAGLTAGGSGNLSLAFFAPVGTASPLGTTGTAGVQTVTITGTPAGGTFTLTWNGKTTAPIVFNATAAVVQAALNALAGGSTITATGGPLPTGVVVTFPAAVNQTLMTANGSALTGGTTPAVVVTQTTAGTQSVAPAGVAPSAAFSDAGLCDAKGIDIKTNISSTNVKAFGTTATVRVLVTDAAKTIDLTFLETNTTSLAVYNSLALGSVVAGANGSISLASGAAVVQFYTALFYAGDGGNKIRYYAPVVQVSNLGDMNISEGQVIDRPLTLSLLPDAAGNTLYEEYLVTAYAV
jgi:hypothetical protein